LEQRTKARRSQIARGRGQWFGAFDGDLLVGDLGIFCDDRVARYQSVQTRATHRRRGVCSALLRMAHDWAKGRSPNARVLIAADADDTPRLLYRKVGFQPFETITAAMKGSY
jgi:GNAT superfamily N-acetyltransferase